MANPTGTFDNTSARTSSANSANSNEQSSSSESNDLLRHANRFAADFSKNASESYDEASAWLAENKGRTMMAVGVVAAIGMMGYFLARGRSSEKVFDRPGADF